VIGNDLIEKCCIVFCRKAHPLSKTWRPNFNNFAFARRYSRYKQLRF